MSVSAKLTEFQTYIDTKILNTTNTEQLTNLITLKSYINSILNGNNSSGGGVEETNIKDAIESAVNLDELETAIKKIADAIIYDGNEARLRTYDLAVSDEAGAIETNWIEAVQNSVNQGILKSNTKTFFIFNSNSNGSLLNNGIPCEGYNYAIININGITPLKNVSVLIDSLIVRATNITDATGRYGETIYNIFDEIQEPGRYIINITGKVLDIVQTNIVSGSSYSGNIILTNNLIGINRLLEDIASTVTENLNGVNNKLNLIANTNNSIEYPLLPSDINGSILGGIKNCKNYISAKIIITSGIPTSPIEVLQNGVKTRLLKWGENVTTGEYQGVEAITNSNFYTVDIVGETIDLVQLFVIPGTQISGKLILSNKQIGVNTLLENLSLRNELFSTLISNNTDILKTSLTGEIKNALLDIKNNTAKISQYQFNLLEDATNTVFLSRVNTITGDTTNLNLSGGVYTPVLPLNLVSDSGGAGGNTLDTQINEFEAITNNAENWSIGDILTRISIINTTNNQVSHIWQSFSGNILTIVPVIGIDVIDIDKKILEVVNSVNSKLNTLGQKSSNNSFPVVLASDQSSIPVTVPGGVGVVNVPATTLSVNLTRNSIPASIKDSNVLPVTTDTAIVASLRDPAFNPNKLSITGALSTAATNNNLLDSTGIGNATDVTKWQSGELIIVSTATTGSYIVQGAFDSGFTIGVKNLHLYEGSTTGTNPLISAITPTSSTRIFGVNLQGVNFIRVNLTTATAGIRPYLVVNQAPFVPLQTNIQQSNGANLVTNINSLPTIANVTTVATVSNITNLGISTFATTTFRNTAVSSTPIAVKTSSGRIYGLNIINLNATPIYLKIYNLLVGSTVVGTSTPAKIYMVNSNDKLFIASQLLAIANLTTAITIAVVTGIADSSSTAPTTAIHVEIDFV